MTMTAAVGAVVPFHGRNMAVRSIDTTILDVPTRRRHRLSSTEISHQSVVLVTVLLENGVTGHGEASTLGGPRWSEESVEAIKANIDTYLAPVVVGLSASDLELASARMAKAAQRNFSAKAAVDAALIDALGRTLDLPAAALLGGPQRDRFPVIWALASGDAGQETEEAREKISSGTFNRFKVKIGFDTPQADLRRLQALRLALPDVDIIVDVNQGWSETTCLRFFPALSELGVALIEQPLHAGQIGGMVRLAARSPIPLMLDEACFTETETLHAATVGAGHVLSLKLVKSGSVHSLKRAAGIAAAAGLELYGGCLLETSLGAAAHLAAFATLPQLHWGTEQFAPQIVIADTVVDPLVYRDYHVYLPKGPGLGVTPDPDRIKSMSRR